MIYQWRSGTRLKLDAQAAGERTEKIRQKAGNAFSPALLVADARRPTSPLHPGFEWDDAKAAEDHRLNQARYILRQLAVVTTSEKGETVLVHAFVSIMNHEDESRLYTSVQHAMADPELREQLLEQVRREARDFRRRLSDFEEFATVCEALDAVLEGQPA
jgi:hypothetical protein